MASNLSYKLNENGTIRMLGDDIISFAHNTDGLREIRFSDGSTPFVMVGLYSGWVTAVNLNNNMIFQAWAGQFTTV